MPPGETDKDVRLGGWLPPAGQQRFVLATRAPWTGALLALAPVCKVDPLVKTLVFTVWLTWNHAANGGHDSPAYTSAGV